jgi:UDPglucose 6-dehydrogenase
MNEIANIAEHVGADVEMVRHGIGADPRIGYHFIYPGAGYGGSCFPKDVQALERSAITNGYDARLLGAVEAVNRDQKRKLFDLVSRHFDGNLRGRTIALWGLAFKPNTDDMREAPSRVLMEALWQAGAKVRAFDPQAREETARIYGAHDDLVLCDDPWTTLQGADALAVATEWKVFRSPDFARVKAMLKTPVLFDGRNLYDPAMVEDAGLAYYGIGRGRSVRRSGSAK